MFCGHAQDGAFDYDGPKRPLYSIVPKLPMEDAAEDADGLCTYKCGMCDPIPGVEQPPREAFARLVPKWHLADGAEAEPTEEDFQSWVDAPPPRDRGGAGSADANPPLGQD